MMVEEEKYTTGSETHGQEHPGGRRDRTNSARSPYWSVWGMLTGQATGPTGREHPTGNGQ